MASEEQRRYRFGLATEDDSLVLGLAPTQVGLLTTGLVGAVLVLRTHQHVGGVVAAAAAVGAAAAICFWPIGGQTVSAWLPTLLRWGTRTAMRNRREVSEVPLLGHDAEGNVWQRPPAPVKDIRLLAVSVADGDTREVGVAHDRRTGTYTAVLSVRGRSFQFADRPEQERRLAAWGRLLAGLARDTSPIHRLQWVDRVVPDTADALVAYLDEAGTAGAGADCRSSYGNLIEGAGPSSPRHETYLVIGVCARRARRAIARAGGGRTGAAEVLLNEVRGLQRQLAGADLDVVGLLTPELLARAIRVAFDPTHRVQRGDDDGDAGPLGGAWPVACETRWSSYRTDGVWHSTYWIEQWPRTSVGPDFLVPLLLDSSGTRTIAVTMAPVPSGQARREVEQARLKQAADEELRSRAGFMASAHRRRAREAVARREEELADGHADYRISGYVTVTAPDPEELERRCGQVEQVAHQAALRLRRLHGRQDLAVTYTLPLARGLGGRP